MKIIATHPTILKSRPVQSIELPATEKIEVASSWEAPIASYTVVDGHFRFTLGLDEAGDRISLIPPSGGMPRNTWHGFQDHFQVVKDDGEKLEVNAASSIDRVAKVPGGAKLKDFPWFSQLDNYYNPFGGCNVTSAAMCLSYWGIKGDGSYAQLEDQLYRRMTDRRWSRHNPYDLKKVIESYPGMVDDFTERGTLDMIRRSIDQGRPVILHGYWTQFGHIVCCTGYNHTHFLIQDPYGEWFPKGYRRDLSGKDNEYRINTLAELISPESKANPRNIYMHSVYRI